MTESSPKSISGYRNIFDQVGQAFERNPPPYVLLIGLPLAALLLVRLVRQPMWLDEFYTCFIAWQPSVTESIKAVKEGCDVSPPLYAILVQLGHYIFGWSLLALRLPSFLGYCLMTVCVYAFLKRRLGALYAATAALLAALCSYSLATEGRPYGMALGCISLALLCWQAAADGRHRILSLIGLTSSMAVAIALHYFTVFVLIPLALAEASRWVFSQRRDLPVFTALVLSPLILIPHLPLIAGGRQFAASYYDKGSWASIPDYYRNIPDLSLWMLGAMVIVSASQIFFRQSEINQESVYPGLLRDEWVACLSLALLPAIGIPIAMKALGVARAAYFFPASVGIGLLFAATLFTAARGRALPALAFMIAIGGWLGSHSLRDAITAPRLRYGAELEQELRNIPADPSPILVESPLAFVELWQYGDPAIRRRVFAIVSRELEMRTGHDTVSRAWLAIIRRVSIPVIPLDQWTASQRPFLLAAGPGPVQDFFRNHGYRFQLLKPDLYLLEPSLPNAIRSPLGPSPQ